MYGKFMEGKGGVLGDDMGLGKTVQTISLISAILRKTGEYAVYASYSICLLI